jgi:hypothetical protein
MVPRPAPVILATIALILVAACAGTATPPASGDPVARGPVPTPVIDHSPLATPTPAVTPVPVTGDVDGAIGGPELTIEAVDEDTIVATLDDPDAKAWRLVVAGTGERAGERWEIVVETGDVGPVISATEIQGGEVVDVMDLTGFWDGTATAGGCHATLPVCLGADGFEVPEGDGRFSVRLELPEAQVPLVISGGTAAWDGEPFILGPWHDTDPFPWGEG